VKTDRTCARCDGPFQVEASRLRHGRGLHCSRECQYAAIKARPSAVALACLCCGRAFTLAPSRLRHKGVGKYCSRECRDKHWVGENTPNWQHGGGVYKRGPNWQATRRRILKRDGYRCASCDAGGTLHVHHVIPFRVFDEADDANRDDNLVSLCPPCHRRADARDKWVKLDGGALQMNAHGYAWALAKERGIA
jgi:5-methylcytosine-specific restriction endonuclease McrA